MGYPDIKRYDPCCCCWDRTIVSVPGVDILISGDIDPRDRHDHTRSRKSISGNLIKRIPAGVTVRYVFMSTCAELLIIMN